MKAKLEYIFLTMAVIFTLAACATESSGGSQTPTSVTGTRTPLFPSPTPTSTATDIPWLPPAEKPAHYILLDPFSNPGYLYRHPVQNLLDMEFGPDGRLYIADYQGKDVVVVNPDGTFTALNLWRNRPIFEESGLRALSFSPDGTLYVNDQSHIYRIDPQGQAVSLPGVEAKLLGGIIFDRAGELYFTDRDRGAVLHWLPEGRSELVAEGIEQAEDMVFGLDGILYVAHSGLDRVARVDLSTGQASEFVKFPHDIGDPIYLAVDEQGDIWVRLLGLLYRYAPDGKPKSYMMNGRTYTSDENLFAPGINSIGQAGGLAFDSDGNLWIGSYNSTLYRLDHIATSDDVPSFELTVVNPGFETSSLAVDSQGRVYCVNEHSQALWRFNPDGSLEELASSVPGGGRTAIAVDGTGMVFIGRLGGAIYKMEDDGSFSLYASLSATQMVFGTDGALYAIEGQFRQPKSIVRITGPEQYTTLAAEIDGIPLGNGGADIFLAPDNELYVFTEWDLNLFRIDYTGQGTLVASYANAGDMMPGPTAITAAPDGTVYSVGLVWWTLYQIDESGNRTQIGSQIRGDPWAAVVSPDGKWLYIAEAGAIDKISIVKAVP